MAYRSQITLSDKDQELLNELKQKSGESSSGAIAFAIKLANMIQKAEDDGFELVLEDKKSKKQKVIKIVR